MSYSIQAADTVFTYITDKIKRMEWPPGTRIDTEAKLVEDLKVSRVAVRQAIEKLSALSVLRKVQGSGTYVESYENTSLMGLPYYPVTKEMLLYMLEFRRMFDSYNTEFFIDKHTPEELKRLEENYVNMKEAKGDKKLFHMYDHEFHDMIARGTKNPIIIQISQLLTGMMEEHHVFLYENVGPEHSIYYHRIILDCIHNNDTVHGAMYAKMHIDNAIKHLLVKSEEQILMEAHGRYKKQPITPSV